MAARGRAAAAVAGRDDEREAFALVGRVGAVEVDPEHGGEGGDVPAAGGFRGPQDERGGEEDAAGLVDEEVAGPAGAVAVRGELMAKVRLAGSSTSTMTTRGHRCKRREEPRTSR